MKASRFSLTSLKVVMLALGTLAMFLPSLPQAHAETVVGQVITLTCTNFTESRTSATLDYHNSTVSGEITKMEITDGTGVMIFQSFWDGGPMGTVFGADSFTNSYKVAPKANPISLRYYSPAGNGLPEKTIATATYNCPGLPFASTSSVSSVFAGPAIPSGFELRTITCDVAVFDTPGGRPIGDNAIKAGQTWYVNPKSEKAADGEPWTEIFVSGYTNSYIPTRCIGR